MSGSHAPRRSAGWPTAATTIAGVIGHPVRHSLSPLLHNAAFAALGLDWAYLAFEVEPGAARTAIAGAGVLGVRGLSVTMPHKSEAASAVDRLGPVASLLGAVNTIVFDESGAYGESTDGAGLVDGLREACAFEARGARCVVLGAGGAGRAVVLALAQAGAVEVAVVNRTQDAAVSAAALTPAGVGRAVTGPAVADLVEGADLVVNATPLGMSSPAPAAATDSLPFDLRCLGPRQLVVDLVYDPPETELLREAAAHGSKVANGLPMLVHQAARQFELWTGKPAPIATMWEALGVGAPGRGR